MRTFTTGTQGEERLTERHRPRKIRIADRQAGGRQFDNQEVKIKTKYKTDKIDRHC